MDKKLTVFRAGTKDGPSFSFSSDHSIRGMIMVRGSDDKHVNIYLCNIYLCMESAKNVKSHTECHPCLNVFAS